MVVSRHEPVFQIYRETEEFQLCQEKYARSGWMPFLEKFTGWHEKISHEFIQGYDGEIAHIGNLQLTINEATLREVTGLPNRGAKYFKGVGINKEMCQRFLKEDHQHPDWKKGIPRNYIKEEYHPMITSLQRFITCEGRYVVTFIYHLRLLLHFEGGPEIDFPYFLWMSLNKMVRGVKSISKTEKTSIYHQGLIKMLVLHELRKQRISWKTLITQHLPTENKPVEETQHAPKKNKEPQKKKGKKDKTTPPSSRAVSQHEKAGSSSTVNKTFKSSESKGKNKLVEETSTVAVEKEGHQTKMMKKGKHSSETKSKQSMAQSPVTISQLEKKKRKPVSTPDPVPPCKRTTRSMEKKGKTIVSPHTQEDPIDLTSPSEDLSVQDDIPSLTEEQATITLCGMREEVEERECIQPVMMESTKTLTKEQMKKKIGELQKQNQELKQEVKEYQLLDRYIKKENEQLKATSQQLQDDHEETSNKLKKVLRLLQYVRVIKRELKEEASAINIIDPPK
jgi:hypothetical protein